MSSTQLRFKKKEYNSSTDASEGIIVFDKNTKSIFVGGVRYSSNVSDTSWNTTTKELTISTINGTTYNINLKDDTSANAPSSLLCRIRNDINTNTNAISIINGSGNGSISKAVSDSITALDGTITTASSSNGVVTLKTTINEVDGLINNTGSSEIVLHKVATTGSSQDISVTYDSNSTDVQTSISDIDSRLVTLASRQIQYIEPSSNATCPSGYSHYYNTNQRRTGNLTASADTMNRIYLCKTTSYTGDYHQIMTVQSGNNYKWVDISTTTIDLSGYMKSVTLNGITYTPTTSGETSLPNVVNTISGETQISGGDGNYISVSTSDTTTSGITTTTISSSLKIKDISTSTSTSNGVATAYDVKTYVNNNLTTIKTWTNSDIQNIGN